MQCPAQDGLQRFLFGELSEKQSRKISGHVDACESCLSVIRRLEQSPDPVFDLVRSLATTETPDDDDSVFQKYRQGLVNLGTRDTDNREDLNLTVPVIGSTGDTSFVPKRIGHYELQELIGRGGMGAVYKARHLNLDRLVAIKILPESMLRSSDAVARFQREMRAVGALDHPNIVHATDAAEIDGTHFIVMQLVDGRDLSALVKSAGRLSVPDSCEIIRQAAMGLQHAHEKELVHRDIKPSNLLLSTDGLLKLLDLGLARINSESANLDELTSTSQIMGTIDYMAPEQADRSHAVDARADLYSLGATLFRFLTGIAPLDAHGCHTPIQKLTALLHQEQPDVKNLREDLPDGLSLLIRQLLSRSPDDRPRSAGEVADALSPFCEGHCLARLVENLEAPVADSDTATNDPLLQTFVAASGQKSPIVAGQNTVSSAGKEPHADVAAQTDDSTADRAASVSERRNRKGLRLVLLAAVALALGVIIRIQTDNGDVVVEIADSISEQVTVNILRDGEREIDGWTVTSSDISRRIRTGRISVEVDDDLLDKIEISFKGGKAELTRNGRVVVTITRKRKSTTDEVVRSNPTRETYRGLRFDGKDDYVEVPSLNISDVDARTIEAYVTPSSLTNYAVIATDALFTLKIDPKSQCWQWIVPEDQEQNKWVWVNSKSKVAIGQRVHLAGSWDGKTISLFVDGKLSGTVNAKPQETAEFPFTIGGYIANMPNAPGSHGRFEGRIDSFRVSRGARYTQDFTPPELIAPDANTLALYQFAGGGPKLRDNSGNDNHGTIFGAEWLTNRSVATAPDHNNVGSGVDLAAVLGTAGQTENILQGILPAPATLPGVGRWQIESVAPRGRISDLRYSPDGQWFACASGDKVVRVYRVTEDGLSFHSAIPDGRPSLQVRWHPNSQLLAIARFMGPRSASPVISIWDIENSVLRQQITADCSLSSIDWSPDGEHLVGAGAFVTRVFCWHISGKLKWQQDDVPGILRIIRWNPTRPVIAVVGEKVVRLLDVESGELLREFPPHDFALGAMEWSPTGRYLATGSMGWNHPNGDTSLRVWSAEGIELSKAGVSGSNVSHVAWSRDEQFIAAGADMVRIWHFESDEASETATLADINSPHPHSHLFHRRIHGLDWSDTGELAFADMHDGGPRFWPDKTNWSRLAFAEYGQLGTLEWSPTDNRFITFNNRGVIREWLRDGAFRHSIKFRSGLLPAYGRSDMAWSPDGELLAASHGDGLSSLIYTTNFSAPQDPTVVTVPQGVAAKLSWSPDSQSLAIAPWISSFSKVYLWNRKLKEVREIGGSSETRGAWIGWNLTGSRLFKVGNRGRIDTIDSVTGTSTVQFTPKIGTSKEDWGGDIIGVAVSPSRDRFTLGCRGRFTACLDIAGGGRALWQRTDVELPLAWHPQAPHIVVRHRSRMLEVLDADSGETLYVLGNFHGNYAIWSKNGEHLASFPNGGKYSTDTLNLVHVWKTDATQHAIPECVCVMLPDGLAASFTPGGSPISLSDAAEEYLRWVVENPDGSLEYLSREEFELRTRQNLNADVPKSSKSGVAPHVLNSAVPAAIDPHDRVDEELKTPQVNWPAEEFDAAGPESVPEPPPLDEWLKDKEIITVAQDGSGDFQSIRAATRPDIVKPGQVIEVLDKGPYVEILDISGLPPDCGLVSRVGTVIVVAGWKPLPSPSRGIVQQLAHFVSRSPGFRLSGFRFHYNRQPFGVDLQFFAFGGGVIENCVFFGTGRAQNGEDQYPDDIRLFLRFRDGLTPEAGEPIARFWVRDNVFLSSLRLQSQVGPPVEYRVTRNLMIGQGRQYRLHLWAGLPADDGVRFLIQQNVFDCRQNGLGIGFINENPPVDGNPANGILEVDRNTFHSIRPDGFLSVNSKMPMNKLSFTRNILDGNQNSWLNATLPFPEAVVFNCVPMGKSMISDDRNLLARRPLESSVARSPDYMRPAVDSKFGQTLDAAGINFIGAVPFHKEDRSTDWLDVLRKRLVEQQEMEPQIASEHGWTTGER